MQESEVVIKIDRKIIVGLMSLGLHAIFFLAANQYIRFANSLDRILEKTTPLVVESINQEMLQELKNYKTVGVKGGSKSGGTLLPEVNQKASAASKARPQSNSSAQNVAKKLSQLENGHRYSKQLDLKSLQITDADETSNANFQVRRRSTIKSVNLKGAQIREFLKNDNFSAPMLNPMANPFVANSGIDVKMEIPEGVDVSELNEAELQFYSFQKRTAMSYISSFYKTLNKFILENPQVKFPLNISREVLTGRITFDKNGNIKTIKMLRSSTDDHMQKFFEDVLEGINNLPNPPRAIVKDIDQFNIYYTLIING
jgi:hypothetical protein